MRTLVTRAAMLVALVGAALPAAARAQDEVRVYGYFATRLEKSLNVPDLNGTAIDRASSPREFSQPFFNVMIQQQFDKHFKAFVNLNGSKAAAVDVRNMWGEYSASNAFSVRVGKIYRKFGLYNEILDAVPTYYGIEPPEAFDTDHLLLSRTTAAMAFGFVNVPRGRLSYALSTDNGEGREVRSTLPLGGDLNYSFGRGSYLIGASGYTSGGATNSDITVGAGSPKSGVLPWMAADSFTVVNGYAEAKVAGLTLQGEYAEANHKAQRDGAAVVLLLARPLNAAQRDRFTKNSAGPNTLANVDSVGDYKVQSWYLRAGRSFDTRVGELGPYAQFDAYRNPETISEKKYGGDDEAGNADDGAFRKYTGGLLYRPIPVVAVKLDGSIHSYRLGGQRVSYPELRFDISYAFGL